jgi:hypothetical protein
LKGFFIRPNQFSKAKQTIKTGKELGEKKKIIVIRRGREMIKNKNEVLSGEGTFAMRGPSIQSFAASKGLGDEGGSAVFANVREETFKIVADARQVIVNGLGVDMV